MLVVVLMFSAVSFLDDAVEIHVHRTGKKSSRYSYREEVVEEPVLMPDNSFKVIRVPLYILPLLWLPMALYAQRRECLYLPLCRTARLLHYAGHPHHAPPGLRVA